MSKVDAKVAIQAEKRNFDLVENCLSSVDEYARSELRNVQNISRNVRHWKKQTSCTPPIPS